MGKLLLTTLAMIAEFEADLTRLRIREGMKIAKAKGRLRGKRSTARSNVLRPRCRERHADATVAGHTCGHG